MFHGGGLEPPQGAGVAASSSIGHTIPVIKRGLKKQDGLGARDKIARHLMDEYDSWQEQRRDHDETEASSSR